MHFQLRQQFGSCQCYIVIVTQRRELHIEALQRQNLFNSSTCLILQILQGLLKIFSNLKGMSTNQAEVMLATHSTCGHVVYQPKISQHYIRLQILKRRLRDSSLFTKEPLSQNLGCTGFTPIVFFFFLVCQYFAEDFILFFKLINLLLFSYNCLHVLPLPPPHPTQSHLPPPPLPSPFILSLCPLQYLLQNPLPTIPSPLPSGYCYNVLNFNVSGYILFAFFFC